jgi:hypothetical protein
MAAGSAGPEAVPRTDGGKNMWRVTWQTGVAYLVFGSVFTLAYYRMTPVDWSQLSIVTMATIGMLGWGLLVSGGLFVVWDAVVRLKRRAAG